MRRGLFQRARRVTSKDRAAGRQAFLTAAAVATVLAATLLTVCASLAGAAPAVANTQLPTSPTATTLSWRVDVPSTQVLWYSTGNYVWVFGAPNEIGTILDATTGTQTTMSAPAGCLDALQPYVAGSRGFLFDCTEPSTTTASGTADAAAIYSPSTQQWTIPDPTALDRICDATTNGSVSCGITGGGDHWLDWEVAVGKHHPRIHFEFQNIATGKLETGVDDPGGRVWDNMDSPTLKQTLCSPLQLPNIPFSETGSAGGVLGIFGRTMMFQSPTHPSEATLQTCGSAKQTHVPVGAVNNGKVLAWEAKNPKARAGLQIDYLVVSTMQRGVWKIPTGIPNVKTPHEGLGLRFAGNRIYVAGLAVNIAMNHLAIYSAPLPTDLS